MGGFNWSLTGGKLRNMLLNGAELGFNGVSEIKNYINLLSSFNWVITVITI